MYCPVFSPSLCKPISDTPLCDLRRLQRVSASARTKKRAASGGEATADDKKEKRRGNRERERRERSTTPAKGESRMHMHSIPSLQELTQPDGERKPLDSLPQFDPAFMKEGYLQKKGQVLKGWKARWFVCDGRTLSYYGGRRDVKPSTVMELKYCAVEDGGRSETWNSTRIHVTDSATGTTYCLSSEDAQVANEWLVVLRNAVARIARDRRQRLATQPSVPSMAGAAAAGAASSSSTEKRTNRVVSAPTHSQSLPLVPGAQQQTLMQRSTGGSATAVSTTPRAATTVSMENDLARDMEILKSLVAKRGAHSSHHGGSVVFSPIGASNNVLKSVGIDPAAKGKWYARGSVVLPVPSEVAAYYVCDHHKRADWDVQFPKSSHVAKFDDATELVHLTKGFQQVRETKPLVAPQAAAAAGAALGGLLASSWSDVMSSMALFALIAALINTVDYSSLCAPRDLLLLRQVKKRKISSALVPIDNDNEDPRQPIITVLEKSVANERKPIASGAVRARQGIGGWLLEPLDGGRTLVTYVTDIDAGGWLSIETKREFLIRRLDCLSVLLEYVNQSQVSVAELGLDDDVESGDESDGSVHEDIDVDTFGGHLHGQRPSSSFHPADYFKGMERISSGGLKLTDKEVAKKQAGVLKDVLKSASGALLEGKGMVGLSLPVRIFEPRTNLERIVDLFLYGPTFLNVAADQVDPVERFKFVMAYAIAGLHHGVGQMKPFNPILGETYQTALNDGTEVFCEHTSHHPPITNFQLMGKKYSICGHVVWNPPTFSMKSSAFVQNNAGPIRISFADGTVITYQLPLMQSGGFLWGDRSVELLGSIRFEDPKNRLVCDLKLNPDEKKGMGGMFSSSATPSDYFRGVILNTGTNSEVAAVSGSWLDGVSFDGRQYWTLGQEQSGYIVPLPESRLLESDSVNREDLRYLAANDLDLAQEWKVKLEVLQRADRKIRNEGRRPNHWSLKDGKSGH